MRYSIEPRDRIYVKRYGFLPFAKNMGTNKVAKNLSKKYAQKLLDSAKKSTKDAIKTALKWAIQKTAEATGDFDKKKAAKNDNPNNEIEVGRASRQSQSKGRTEKKIHISRRKTTNYWWVKVSTKKGCIFLEIIDELKLTLKKDSYL